MTDEFPLDLTAPCFFLRRHGKLQSFTYGDVGLDFVAIVARNTVSDANRKTWNLKQEYVCWERSQAVLGSSHKVRPSKLVHSDGVYCRDQGVDEKESWSFANAPK